MNGLTRERIQALAQRELRDSRDHLEEAGESYTQHLWFTVRISARLLFTSIALTIHGLIPSLFTRTASSQMEAIYLIMKSRIPKARLQELENDWQI